MNVIKNLSVALMSFLLFIAIIIFGFLFMVNSTVMNPDFIKDRINSLDVDELIDEFVEFEASPEAEESVDMVREIIPKVEPVVKERLLVAVDSVYDYLLGEKAEPDIKGTLGESFLNPEFIDAFVAELSLPELVETALKTGEGEGEFPEEFVAAITDIVTEMEPEIKEQLPEIAEPVFNYILGQTQTLDLSGVLRDTVLNEDFVVPLVEKLDLSALAEEMLADQLTGQIPAEMEFLTDRVGAAIDIMEPVIKEEFRDAAGPLLDYMLGESRTLSIQISLDEVVDSLENTLKNELLESPPPEYSDLSRGELEQLFSDTLGGRLSEILPSTFEIDESIIGPEVVGDFAGAIADAEDSITDVRNELDSAIREVEEPLRTSRQYISYFQLVYTLLIVFIGLMLLGIILVLRDVKAITRRIGVPLLIYGAIEYAGIWVARYFLNGNLPFDDIPPGVESWIFDLSSSVMRPLEIFSLALLVIGAVLTVVSFIYKRSPKEPGVTMIEEQQDQAPQE